MLVVLWAWLLHIFVMLLMYSRFLCETCLLCATYGTGHRFTVTNRYAEELRRLDQLLGGGALPEATTRKKKGKGARLVSEN